MPASDIMNKNTDIFVAPQMRGQTPPRPNTRTPPGASTRIAMGAAPFKPSTNHTDYSPFNAGPPMSCGTSKPEKENTGFRAGPPMSKHEWQSGGGDILVKAVKKEAQSGSYFSYFVYTSFMYKEKFKLRVVIFVWRLIMPNGALCTYCYQISLW